MPKMPRLGLNQNRDRQGAIPYASISLFTVPATSVSR